jgi:hypothetical protein
MREVTMIALTDEHASALKQGYPVRVFVPQFDGGGVVLVLAVQRESTESLLQETLDEIREKLARSRDAPDAAGLLAARFQLQGHGQIVGQPQRQCRQRLTDGEGVSPRPEVPGIPLARPAAV